MPLLTFRRAGIYCAQGGFYIDPWRKVKKAVITHGHSDHARWGMGSYLCSSDCVGILKHRIGKDINVAGLPYGQTTDINGVKLSFHPAGHVLGSAQVRVEYKGEIWVVTGDYKTVDDGISTAFEPVKCQHFVTETTFGLPVYRWKPQNEIFSNINSWWSQNAGDDRPSVISAYSLGKAQRVLSGLDSGVGPIYVHNTIAHHNAVYEATGVKLPEYHVISPEVDKKELKKAVIVVPGMAMEARYLANIKNASTAAASGWMQVRGARRRRNMERGFVLSDHADWPGLNQAIKATGADNIYVTHGYTRIMKDWLIDRGYNASIVETEYGEEEV
jgi:putative mRNA 3-end processing factor